MPYTYKLGQQKEWFHITPPSSISLSIFVGDCNSSEFDDQVLGSVKFIVGYIDGRHQMSLFNVEDLSSMCSKYKLGGKIILWCEDRCTDDNHGSWKRGLEAAYDLLHELS